MAGSSWERHDDRGDPIAVDTVIAVKGIFDWVDLIWVSPAGMKGCWKRIRASSPRAAARPFGLRGLTPASAFQPMSSMRSIPCRGSTAHRYGRIKGFACFQNPEA